MSIPAAAAVILSASAIASAQTPGFHLQGFAPGAHMGITHALSQSGEIAAGVTSGSGGGVTYSPGFTWTQAGGRYDFGLEPGMPVYSPAFALSSDGHVIAGDMRATGNAPNRAYRRVGAGPLDALGTMGYSTSWTHGISGDGNTVVGKLETFNPTIGHYEAQAFRWSPSTGMQGLGWMGGIGMHSDAQAISRDGSTIVGISEFTYPFVWRDSTGMQLLPVHPGAPNHNGYAYGVDANGDIIVGRARNAAGQNVATRWTSLGIEELSLLPGATNSIAYAVSDNGLTIGGSSGIFPSQVATVWVVGAGATSLTDYLTSQGIFVPSGWSLEYIYAISGDGMTFAGEARSPEGIRQGFVATVPAPAGLVAFVCAAPFALRRRRGTVREASANSYPLSPSESLCSL